MPKPVASVGEGDGASSKFGVYNFIRDLICEGKHAWFVNSEGRFAVNWPRALECYEEYKSSKNPAKTKSRSIDKRKASNGLRAALLNFYKKEGAKEFKECKKVNEKDEVIERQFQMPPRMFKIMFEDSHVTEDSEQDSSSLMSEDEDATANDQIKFTHGSPRSSDTGFDEAMDVFDGSPNAFSDHSFSFSRIPDDSEQGEIDQENVPWNLSTPSQMFQMSEEEFDTAVKDILSDGISESDMDPTGVVQDISPSSGSVKGGQCFHILLSEPLPDEVVSGIACFESCGTVFLDKINCSTFKGMLPAAQQAGPVPVTVQTLSGQYLGKTWFFYVDEVQEVLKQLVKDPAMQALFFNLWAQEHRSLGNDSDVSQRLYPLIGQNQGSSNQNKSVQSLEILQLLIYTAAQTNAQQFIKMIFSTSAGKAVFDAYKNRSPLPEDVAMANGHHELAVYLQDITGRYSEENGVQSGAIDWLELAQAVQDTNKQTSTSVPSSQETDDNFSDYFADVETSSCGSFDFEWCDSEEKDFSVNDKRSPEEQDTEEPTGLQGASDKGSYEQWKDYTKKIVLQHVKTSTEERSSSRFGKKIIGWLFRGREKRNPCAPDGTSPKTKDATTKKPGGSSEPRVWPTSSEASKIHCNMRNRKHGVLYAIVVVLLFTGFKLNEDWLLHWAVENGEMDIANILIKFGGDINAHNAHMRIPLHLAAKQGHKEITQFLLQRGSYIDVGDCSRQTPLHLAVQNGHKEVAKILLQHGVKSCSQDFRRQTPLHLAAQNGHKEVVEVLLQRGVDSCLQDFKRKTPLHLAVQNGHAQVAEVLLHHGIDSSTQDFRGQSALHLAAQVGHKGLVDVLLQHGAKAFVQDLNGQTSLHLAAKYGHKQIVEVLVEQLIRSYTVAFSSRNPLQRPSLMSLEEAIHSADAHIEDVNGQTPLHLAARYGHKDVTQILLRRGFDAIARDLRGKTPLHLAAQNKHQQIAVVVLQHGMNTYYAQNRKQQTDCTLHQYVACSRDPERQNLDSFAEDFKGQNLHRSPVTNGHKQSAVTLHSRRAGVYRHSYSDRFDLVAKYQRMETVENPVLNVFAACSEDSICRTPYKEITDSLHNDVFTQDVMCRAPRKEITDRVYNNSIAKDLKCRTSYKEITGRLHNDSIDFRRQGPIQVSTKLRRKNIVERPLQHGMLLALSFFCFLSCCIMVTVLLFVFTLKRRLTQVSGCNGSAKLAVALGCDGSADTLEIGETGDELKLRDIQTTGKFITSKASRGIIYEATGDCDVHWFHRTDVSQRFKSCQSVLHVDEMRLEYRQYEADSK